MTINESLDEINSNVLAVAGNTIENSQKIDLLSRVVLELNNSFSSFELRVSIIVMSILFVGFILFFFYYIKHSRRLNKRLLNIENKLFEDVSK